MKRNDEAEGFLSKEDFEKSKQQQQRAYFPEQRYQGQPYPSFQQEEPAIFKQPGINTVREKYTYDTIKKLAERGFTIEHLLELTRTQYVKTTEDYINDNIDKLSVILKTVKQNIERRQDN